MSTQMIGKQKRTIITRQSVFNAGVKVFSEKGLHGARIEEITKFSKVNKQRIYAYFGSKKGLYRQILLTVYSTAAENKRLESLTEKDIPQLTTILLEEFFKFHEENPEFWRILKWENLNGGKNLSKADWKLIQTTYIQHLRQLYSTGQQQGFFRNDVDFSTYLLMLFSITNFYYSNQLTISCLLDLKLERKEVQHKIGEQFNIVMKYGVETTK